MSKPPIYVGMDVHQDTITVAVFEGASKEPSVVLNRPGFIGDLVS